MSNQAMQPVDSTGPTLEEAIQNGLAKLGLTRNDVIIEIVDEGSKGVLGLGVRDAVVQLTPLRTAAAPAAAPEAVKARDVSADDDGGPEHPPTPEEMDEEASVGQEVLNDLLKHMDIRGKISLERSENGGAPDESPWILDIHGPNLGSMIGRRGETLEAIQYLTRLIVNHRLQRRTTIMVDVESYKTRRVATLKKLAERMAAQARQMGRTVSLEPMPASERRIIHLALQEDHTVRTESVGEGERRKVTIIPVNPVTK